MKVQWAIKGMYLDDDAAAVRILRSKAGLFCNWGRAVGGIPIEEISDRLTPQSIDMHVNHFSDKDPLTGRPFWEQTPYISLSCGTVERSTAAQTNFVYRARRTALQFGTRFGERSTAYLFRCWVVVAPRAAAEIHGVAEEVRDLTAYRRYSAFGDQGEIAAKLVVLGSQIHSCERWDWDRPQKIFRPTRTWSNPSFIHPDRLSNVRELV